MLMPYRIYLRFDEADLITPTGRGAALRALFSIAAYDFANLFRLFISI